jgi:hypothetical protein
MITSRSLRAPSDAISQIAWTPMPRADTVIPLKRLVWAALGKDLLSLAHAPSGQQRLVCHIGAGASGIHPKVQSLF